MTLTGASSSIGGGGVQISRAFLDRTTIPSGTSTRIEIIGSGRDDLNAIDAANNQIGPLPRGPYFVSFGGGWFTMANDTKIGLFVQTDLSGSIASDEQVNSTGASLNMTVAGEGSLNDDDIVFALASQDSGVDEDFNADSLTVAKLK